MGQIYRPSLDRRRSDEYVMPPCTKVDPEIFSEYKSRKAAQAICLSCPVLLSCQMSVLGRNDNPSGVWGGWTEDERSGLRRLLTCRPAD